MKAIIVLLVGGALVLGGVYYFGGYQSFDPNEKGKQARAAITPGMPWTQVLDIAGSNPKYQPINMMPEKFGNRTVEVETPGTPVNFDRKRLEQRLKKNEAPNGFILQYKYSEATAFAVRFDGSGSVVDVEDMFTMADLLQLNR